MFILLGNPSVKNGGMGKVGYMFFILFVFLTWLLLWFTFNACVGNVEPTVWDFIWQTAAVFGFFSLFL